MRSKTSRILINRRFLCVLAILPGLLLGQVIIGLPIQVFASALNASQPTETAETDSGQTKYRPPLEIEHSSASAAIIETGRLRMLYDKSADVRQNIPTASKIMTALIACEKLELDTQVTISKVAAAADSNRQTGDGVELKTGDKYPLEYLLLRLLFYNSDAAALAIAEQIANVEENFVDIMNAKAASYELSDTVFKNCTGVPVFDTNAPASPDNEFLPTDSLQYTTPSDLARLVSYAVLDENFAKSLRKESEYLVLDGKVLVAMSNELHNIWTLSEGKDIGAFYAEWNGQSYMVAIGKINDINLVAVTAGGAPASRMSDLQRLFQACARNYVSTPLVEAGERFNGETEQTVDGETFGLLYKKTVYYVHPADDLFLMPTFRYNSFGPHSRPIQRSMTVGQVIIELKDGTTISVDVCPDRQILSSISILDKVLGELQSNRNLTIVLIAATVCLLLVMLVQVIIGTRKLIHLIRLIMLEKRSRR